METQPPDDASIVGTIDEQAGRFVEALPDLAAALVVLVVFLVVGIAIGRAVRLALHRRGDRVHADFLARLPAWVFGFIGLIIATDFLGLEGVATGLLAGGGATAIILGFAFRGIGENFLAGLFLAFSRPFRLGDLIRSGTQPEGTVVAVALRSTHIRTTDGCDVYIPNAAIFNDPLVNLTRDGMRRPTFTIGVDYRCPMEQVRAAIRDAVAAVPGVLAAPPPYAVIIEFLDSHVRLEVAVWINTFDGTQFNEAQSLAMEATRRTILDNGWAFSADVATALTLSRAGADAGKPSP